MSCTVGAVMIQQKGVTMYIGAMAAKDVVRHAQVDFWEGEGSQGYQRPLVKKRIGEVGEYLIHGEGVLPTSVLLSVRMDDDVFFEGLGGLGATGDYGELVIPADTRLWIVDGQHRISGLKHALNRGHEELNNYPLPVTILEGATPFEEMKFFNIVNTRQKAIPTDIVDQHLVRLHDSMGVEMVRAWGMNTVRRARAGRIVNLLNRSEGPWENQVKIPGVEGRQEGIIRHHTLVASLAPTLNDPWLEAHTDDAIADLLRQYWEAMGRIMGIAFTSPREYRVQSTVGVYVYHMLFPDIVRACLSAGELSSKMMERVLRYTNMTSQSWHREYGDPRTRATGLRSIREFHADLRKLVPGPGTL